MSVLLPAPLGPTRPIISPGSIVRSRPCSTSRGPYLKRTPRSSIRPSSRSGVDRPHRLRHARLTVEDLEDPLALAAARCVADDHADHRLDLRVEPGDVSQERDQHADRHSRLGRPASMPNAQTTSRPPVVNNVTVGPKKRPERS